MFTHRFFNSTERMYGLRINEVTAGLPAVTTGRAKLRPIVVRVSGAEPFPRRQETAHS